MKELLKCILLVLLTTTCAYAQERPMQRIHAAKMAYITDKLQLSEDQSVRFMPIYRDYETELRALRQPFIKKYKLQQADDGGEFTARQYIEDDLDYQQQVIELKRRYNDKFQKVLSARQVADMYVAEREFRLILMQRLKQQGHGMRGRR